MSDFMPIGVLRILKIAVLVLLAGGTAGADMRPEPRPTDHGSIVVIACPGAGELPSGPAAIILGDDAPPKFAVFLDEAGDWSLVMVIPGEPACPLGSGTFLGVSPSVSLREPGEEA